MVKTKTPQVWVYVQKTGLVGECGPPMLGEWCGPVYLRKVGPDVLFTGFFGDGRRKQGVSGLRGEQNTLISISNNY